MEYSYDIFGFSSKLKVKKYRMIFIIFELKKWFHGIKQFQTWTGVLYPECNAGLNLEAQGIMVVFKSSRWTQKYEILP
jgi:hypothetical protein